MPGLYLLLGIYMFIVTVVAGWDYARWAEESPSRAEWWYTILAIYILGLPSAFINEDWETGILYGRLHKRSDRRRSNAADIQAERALLLELQRRPRTSEVVAEINASEARLLELRQHDANIEAAAALSVLDDDLKRARQTAELTREAEKEAAGPLPDLGELASRRPWRGRSVGGNS